MTTDVPTPTLEEVAPGIFAYLQLHGQWGLNNAGFILAQDTLTVIDTCFTERRSRDFAAAVKRTGGQRPVRTLINTHHHGDHTHGNYIFGNIDIIGHEMCREEVITTGLGTKALWPYVDWGEIIVTPPNIVFRDRLTIYSGDTEIQLIYVGPAHTTNDIVAWLPKQRVLFAGDTIFNGGTPFIVMGSLSGSLAAINSIRQIIGEPAHSEAPPAHPEPVEGPDSNRLSLTKSSATIVPGHGPICDATVLDDIERYLRFIEKTARDGYEAGLAPLDLARATDLTDFAHLHDSERLVANIHRAYAELNGAAPGTPIPLGTVMPDMIAYNGGEVPKCLA
jgi:cyclase